MKSAKTKPPALKTLSAALIGGRSDAPRGGITKRSQITPMDQGISQNEKPNLTGKERVSCALVLRLSERSRWHGPKVDGQNKAICARDPSLRSEWPLARASRSITKRSQITPGTPALYFRASTITRLSPALPLRLSNTCCALNSMTYPSGSVTYACCSRTPSNSNSSRLSSLPPALTVARLEFVHQWSKRFLRRGGSRTTRSDVTQRRIFAIAPSLRVVRERPLRR
jgi:hypothetical protein